MRIVSKSRFGMFFFSVCKNYFAVSARWHVANVTRCSKRSVYLPTLASWRQQQTLQQGVCVRAEVKWLQRLKNRISSVTQWSSYTHCHTHTPQDTHNLTTPEVTDHWNGPIKRATQSCLRRGHKKMQDNHNSFRLCSTEPSFLSSPHLLGLRLFPLSSVASSGLRGLCSGKPCETTADIPPAGDQTETSQTADRLTDPGQGLFKFKELYENPWTIPNLLCVCRIALAPVLGVLITEQHFHISLGLFALAGFTDVLDGYIARNWASQKSALGSALDPLADKILISVLYVSLTYAQLIPALLTVLVIARDIGLIAAVFYVRYKTVPPPVTLGKFFNPCYTTAQLKPTTLSKVNTAVQLFLVAASLASPVFHYTDSLLLQALWYITAVTTTVSGYSYYHYGMKTVAVLNSPK